MSASLPQPPCAEWAVMLHALLDGELDVLHALQCEEHLEGCHGCQAELARLRGLRSILSQDGVRWNAPEALRTRILAHVLQQQGTGAHQRERAGASGWERILAAVKQWSLIPSLAALAASLFIVFGPLGREVGLPEDLVASHVRSLQVDHLTDVDSSNRHVVKPWFVGMLDFAPPVVDISERGFPLIGGRVDYVDRHVVSALVYRHDRHIINLFIWPASTASRAAVVRDGYNLLNWSVGGLTFWAVTDLEVDELRRFQREFVAATPR